MGGFTGLFLASLAVDVHLNGTYFVVAHFHYVMVGGAVMAYIGGLHYWWPKITGRHVSGHLGAHRRRDYFHRLQFHLLPSIHARLFGHAPTLRGVSGGISVPERAVVGRSFGPRGGLRDSAHLFRVVHALRAAGGPNPWGAKGLEWTTLSPPPTENFDDSAIVTEDAYNYAYAEATACLISAHPSTGHPPGFAHQFETVEQQREAGRLGMWRF